jgi:hypothetical protein
MLWPVSIPALTACIATAEPLALAGVTALAAQMTVQMTVQCDHLLCGLATPAGSRSSRTPRPRSCGSTPG